MNSYFNFIDTKMLDKQLLDSPFPFSKYLFWDSPLENIHPEEHKTYIVERVLTKGFLKDFYLLQKMYSQNEIREAILKSNVLDPKTANFCSTFYQIPLSELHVSSFYS
jgi:hypothetical protein